MRNFAEVGAVLGFFHGWDYEANFAYGTLVRWRRRLGQQPNYVSQRCQEHQWFQH